MSKKRRPEGGTYFHSGLRQQISRNVNLGKARHRTELNREAVAQVVSYCFVAAARDVLGLDAAEAEELTVCMNRRADVYTCLVQAVGVERARQMVADRTKELMGEPFVLPAGRLLKKKSGQVILAERRDAAYMVTQFGAEALHELHRETEEIRDVLAETRRNYSQFLEWAEDGEWVAYERLRRVVADVYETDAGVEQIGEEKPIFAKEF